MATKKRKPVRPYPAFTLESALVVAKAIADKNAGKAFDRLLVAQAVGRKPASSEFKALLSASRAYGLTNGTEKANDISLTDLGTRIAMPATPADRVAGLREAVSKPPLFKKVFEHFNRNKLPSGEFFSNQLQRTFDVPADHADEAVELIEKNANYAGILEDISGSKYVRLSGSANLDLVDNEQFANDEIPSSDGVPEEQSQRDIDNNDAAAEKPRVFIAHGSNMEIVEQVKTMLEIADLDAEVAEESESTAIPVPEKVREAMRRCDAAVICVTNDVSDPDADAAINQNVLIEIGAAFVLYDKQVVLVWDKNIPIPSNLQGLYRCEVDGDELSWSTGMKLMAAIKKFKPKN